MTCRFGVRLCPNSGSGSCFEVFDRATDTAMARGMSRAAAEADALHRNLDISASPVGVDCPDLPEVAVLCAAIDTYVAGVGRRSLTFVARAAQSLDELRAELDYADRVVAEQQARIEQLYKLFPDSDDDCV